MNDVEKLEKIQIYNLGHSTGRYDLVNYEDGIPGTDGLVEHDGKFYGPPGDILASVNATPIIPMEYWLDYALGYSNGAKLNREIFEFEIKKIKSYIDRHTKQASKTEKRVDLDVRPEGPWRKNYDYGEGLFSGKMDKYKSIKDFLNKKRKRKINKAAWLLVLAELEKFCQ